MNIHRIEFGIKADYERNPSRRVFFQILWKRITKLLLLTIVSFIGFDKFTIINVHEKIIIVTTCKGKQRHSSGSSVMDIVTVLIEGTTMIGRKPTNGILLT